MHISDGILNPFWITVWYIIAAVLTAIGIYAIKKNTKYNEQYFPMVALMGAAVFIISVWHLPVPVTGSSSHPIGTPMASLVIGPFATIVVSVVGLFFHMFLGHGGITTLGANTVSLGIVGSFFGFGSYYILRRLHVPIWWSAGIAAFIGNIGTYCTTALELALSLFPDSVFRHFLIFSAGFVPTQIPLAIIEFFFTAYIISYLHKVKPELLYKFKRGF
ncbi:energy-coupling factor ABC transporter permease [Candidatus Woesearchaeota archaeon CG10_big_fil_rev_8_21_14_0_10_34_8]|nr:MAG: energy-coupling factor ABC transporter permease [Candidatus Woesearchaeota archaeon CG10_big_fil_rev_8_21_14_0_10_34_8]